MEKPLTVLTTEIRAYANAIDATDEPDRIEQNLQDLIKLAKEGLRQLAHIRVKT